MIWIPLIPIRTCLHLHTRLLISVFEFVWEAPNIRMRRHRRGTYIRSHSNVVWYVIIIFICQLCCLVSSEILLIDIIQLHLVNNIVKFSCYLYILPGRNRQRILSLPITTTTTIYTYTLRIQLTRKLPLDVLVGWVGRGWELGGVAARATFNCVFMGGGGQLYWEGVGVTMLRKIKLPF